MAIVNFFRREIFCARWQSKKKEKLLICYKFVYTNLKSSICFGGGGAVEQFYPKLLGSSPLVERRYRRLFFLLEKSLRVSSTVDYRRLDG